MPRLCRSWSSLHHMRTSTPLRRLLPLLALLAVVPASACGQTGSSGNATPAGGGGPTAGSASGPTGPASTDATHGTASSDVGASASGHGVRLEATFTIGFPEQPTDPGVRKRPGVVVTYRLTREGV